VFANDHDGDNDVHAYLVRRKVVNGLALPGAYRVLAYARSDGAENNVMRQFTDTSIVTPLVNNQIYSYMIEMVNCGGPEPYAVQVVTSRA
jgi:hypothetical protein